jgi:hypothetical protein
MTRIFISHSSKDQDFVRSVLKPLLEGPETLAWCSSTDMLLAADWQKQIRGALAQTDWFLVVLSPDAQESAWVQAETHWALEHLSGRVIPIMARTCEPGEVHLRLGTIQYIDFRSNPDDAAQRLLDLVQGRPAAEPTRLRTQAPAGEPDHTVVLKAHPRAEVSLFIEPATTPGYKHHLSIRNWATIGRAEDADLRIADDCVSRKHARVSAAPSQGGTALRLSDLGSSNGTFVNGQRILSEHLLAPGDLIEIGNARIRVLAID